MAPPCIGHVPRTIGTCSEKTFVRLLAYIKLSSWTPSAQYCSVSQRKNFFLFMLSERKMILPWRLGLVLSAPPPQGLDRALWERSREPLFSVYGLWLASSSLCLVQAWSSPVSYPEASQIQRLLHHGILSVSVSCFHLTQKLSDKFLADATVCFSHCL